MQWEDFDETFINADSDSKSAIFDYEFLFNDVKVEYHYEKGSDRRIMREALSFDRSVIFDCDSEGRLIDSNLEAIGAKSLNCSFAGGYSSALAYISSNAPVQKDSVLGQMRSFTQSIAMAVHDGWGSSRTLARYLQQIIARGLVGDLESFLTTLE